MLASLTFLTPLASLVALSAVVPLVASAVAAGRVARVRSLLALSPPDRTVDARVLIALAAVVLLLALAAAQPALSRTSTQRVRTDAAALFIIDTSRSMAASPGPRDPTRLTRALAIARRLRAAVPQVPAGIATLTDRVLPDLLPVPDVAAFDATLEHSVGIEEPPPTTGSGLPFVTTFGPLAAAVQSGYFDPSVRRRVVVLLSDGEGQPLDLESLARDYAKTRTAFVAVRVWRPRESVYRPNGRPETSYVTDPTGLLQLQALATALDGRAFDENAAGAASPALRAALGNGPTRKLGRTRRTHPLAPYFVLLALLPLASALRLRGVSAPRRAPAPQS